MLPGPPNGSLIPADVVLLPCAVLPEQTHRSWISKASGLTSDRRTCTCSSMVSYRCFFAVRSAFSFSVWHNGLFLPLRPADLTASRFSSAILNCFFRLFLTFQAFPGLLRSDPFMLLLILASICSRFSSHLLHQSTGSGTS